MSSSFPSDILTIALAISIATVAQWRIAGQDIVDRLAPRWRAAAMTLELAAVVIVLATGATIAYVIVGAGYDGKPISRADRQGLIAAIEWQAGWLALSAIVPRVAALMPERSRATVINTYGMLFAAFLAVFIGLTAAAPIVGRQPSRHLLMAIILPTAAIAAFVGWFYSGWQTVRRPKSEPVLLDDGLVPVQAHYAYRGETVDVRLWQDGLALYATHATLDETCFQQRRIRREQQRHGETVAHAPRILFVAPRFEPPILREGRTTWRDRGFRRALAVCAGRRPLTPDDQEHHLPGHPQHMGLWEWPAAFEIRDQHGRTVVPPTAAAS